MSLQRILARTLLTLATIGLLLPPPQEVSAATATSLPGIQDVAIQDVELSAGGTLRGQILDPQGVADAGAAVSIQSQQGVVAQTRTDQNGEFAVTGMRGGVYVVQTQRASSVYRVWSEGTAPPQAADGVLLVSDGSTVRGNHLSDWGIGGVIVLGIGATIVALAVRDRDAS